jgi:hypothetical protein
VVLENSYFLGILAAFNKPPFSSIKRKYKRKVVEKNAKLKNKKKRRRENEERKE